MIAILTFVHLRHASSSFNPRSFGSCFWLSSSWKTKQILRRQCCLVHTTSLCSFLRCQQNSTRELLIEMRLKGRNSQSRLESWKRHLAMPCFGSCFWLSSSSKNKINTETAMLSSPCYFVSRMAPEKFWLALSSKPVLPNRIRWLPKSCSTHYI